MPPVGVPLPTDPFVIHGPSPYGGGFAPIPLAPSLGMGLGLGLVGTAAVVGAATGVGLAAEGVAAAGTALTEAGWGPALAGWGSAAYAWATNWLPPLSFGH